MLYQREALKHMTHENQNNISTTGDVSIGNEGGKPHTVSMQVLQDLYSELTGKTEELNRGYDIPYRCTLDDIKQLNLKINQMYEQYHICSSNCSVTVYHDEDRNQVYSSFERFELYDRSLVSPTESVLLQYNFIIILPKTKRAQNYVLSVRIGSSVTMLRKMGGGSPMQARILKMISARNATVSIEYVDYIVARSFLDAIDGWFKALDSGKASPFRAFLQKNSRHIPGITKYSVGLFSGYLVYKYGSTLVPVASTDLNNLFISILISSGFIFCSYSLAKFFGKSAGRSLDMITELSYLQLNRGDEKAIEEFKARNRTKTIQAILGVLGSFGIGVLSSITASNIMT